MLVVDGWWVLPLHWGSHEMLCGVWASLQSNQMLVWWILACVVVDTGVVVEEAVLRLFFGDWDMDMWLVLWERMDTSLLLSSLMVGGDSGLVKIVVGVCGWNEGG